MQILYLTPKTREFLAEVMRHAVVDCAATLAPLDAVKNPHSYDRARDRLESACAILADLSVLHASPLDIGSDGVQAYLDDINDRPPRREVPAHAAPNREPSDMERETYEQARREGVEPIRELFEIDPRASEPHCIHGAPFSVPCDLCTPAGSILTDEEANRDNAPPADPIGTWREGE